MKKIMIAALVGMVAAPVAAQPSGSATANGTAQATVVEPIRIDPSVNGSNVLNFGSFSVGSGGTVVVDPITGAASHVGTFAAGTVTATADEFELTGAPGGSVNIAFNPQETLTQSSGGGATMTFSLETDTPTVTLDPVTGLGTFRVGGILNVAADQVVDVYTGSYTIVATYP